jgi:hypothetical protein
MATAIYDALEQISDSACQSPFCWENRKGSYGNFRTYSGYQRHEYYGVLHREEYVIVFFKHNDCSAYEHLPPCKNRKTWYIAKERDPFVLLYQGTGAQTNNKYEIQDILAMAELAIHKFKTYCQNFGRTEWYDHSNVNLNCSWFWKKQGHEIKNIEELKTTAAQWERHYNREVELRGFEQNDARKLRAEIHSLKSFNSSVDDELKELRDFKGKAEKVYKAYLLEQEAARLTYERASKLEVEEILPSWEVEEKIEREALQQTMARFTKLDLE